MPIYEYESQDPSIACAKCVDRFEVIHFFGAAPLCACPDCGAGVKRVVSGCRGIVGGRDESHASAEKVIRGYENRRMWSHAAELAEKEAGKMKDEALQIRALDNYKKAGYDLRSLEKHAKKRSIAEAKN